MYLEILKTERPTLGFNTKILNLTVHSLKDFCHFDQPLIWL